MKKHSLRKLKKHGSEILIVASFVSGMTAVVLAVKETPKALRLIDEAKAEKQDELTPAEIVKVTWKCYISAAISCLTMTTCMAGAITMNHKRTAALATACELSKAAFVEYRDNVVETIGEKKAKVIQENIDRKKLSPVISSEDIESTGYGDTLFMDALTGRKFTCNVDHIKRAMNTINKRMLEDDNVYLGDMYSEIGLSYAEIGEFIGWNVIDGLVEVVFTSQITTINGKEQPCIVMSFSMPPSYDIEKSIYRR